MLKIMLALHVCRQPSQGACSLTAEIPHLSSVILHLYSVTHPFHLIATDAFLWLHGKRILILRCRKNTNVILLVTVDPRLNGFCIVDGFGPCCSSGPGT